jgi:hypothetical protein
MISSDEGTTDATVVIIASSTAGTVAAHTIRNRTCVDVIMIDGTTDCIGRNKRLYETIHRCDGPSISLFSSEPVPSKNKWYDFDQQWAEYIIPELLTYIFIALAVYNIRSRLWKRHIKPFRWS